MASKINFNGSVIEMPTKISQLENDANFVNEERLASSGYATESFVEEKVNEKLSGGEVDYNTLLNKPTIGTRYYEGNQGFAVVSSDGTENGIYFKSDDFKTAAAGPIPNDYRTISLKDVVRITDVAQDISGIKNFTGSLLKNGDEVATTTEINTLVGNIEALLDNINGESV
jgi:hypothetical protein